MHTGLASPPISDPRHPAVRAARKLAKRSVRRQTRMFLIEGPQATREAGNAGRLLQLFCTSQAVAENPDIIDSAIATGVDIALVTEDVLRHLTETVTPQGVVAVGRVVTADLPALLNDSPRLLTVLAFARDPGNVGTVIRCADAAGSDGVVIGAESVDVHNGKCVRASAGSLFHLPVTVDVPLAEGLPLIRHAGLIILAADVSGSATLDDAIDTGTLSQRVAWVFGNEAWGLPDAIRRVADDIVRVPVYGRAESLNLATAAAVCLYATARAQRRPQAA